MLFGADNCRVAKPLFARSSQWVRAIIAEDVIGAKLTTMGPTSKRRMTRSLIALMALAALGSCGILGDKKPKTPVLGNRLPVLNTETGTQIEPTIADVAVELPAAESNGAWPQPGGNAAHAMGHLALGQALGRAWTAKIAGGSKKVRLAAGPVVAEGRVYVTDTEATIRAFKVSNGSLIWQTRLTDAQGNQSSLFGGGVSFDSGKLYATNGVGDVAALDAASGAVVWRVRPGGPLRGAPTIADGQVYVVSQDNQIFALKQENGQTVWNEAATLETSGVFGVAAPASAQGTVVAGFSSGELTAFRYENGRAVWQDALSRTSISTAVASLSDIDADPVIVQGHVYAVGAGGRMVALELVTGQRLWELNIAGTATPWVAGDWLFVVTDDAKLLCVQRTSGKVRWISQLPRWKDEQDKKGPIHWTGPVLAGGRLLLVSSQGRLASVAFADGKLGATTQIGAPVFLAPVVAEASLFILDNEGRLSAWR
jgi:outer membrane protein assembly factor BamB